MVEQRDRADLPQVRVGLMADPGLALALAKKLLLTLPQFLKQRVDAEVEWNVSAEKISLPQNSDGEVALTENSAVVRGERGWDYLVYITDLPQYVLDEPLIVRANSTYNSAMVVLPALGIRGVRRLQRVIAQTIKDLHRGEGQDDSGRLESPISRISSVDVGMDEPDSMDTVETAKGVLGRLALLTGMVHSNTPLKLVPRLSSAMAAAIAAGAFGIFYTSIWSMADYLHPLRLLMISLLSVTIMSGWLLASHGLWERPEGLHIHERRLLYNTVTMATVLIAVTAMYVALFTVILLGALVVIKDGYLEEYLRESVGFIDYVNLAWLSASLGTIAGAVGSSLSDPDVVRKGTFSNREYERRRLTWEVKIESVEDDSAQIRE